jgi:hypothetical protein
MDPKGKGIVINDKEKESFVNDKEMDHLFTPPSRCSQVHLRAVKRILRYLVLSVFRPRGGPWTDE